MTLFWSIRPFEEVMRQTQEDPELEELRLGSVTMLVANLGESVRIERIISPRLKDYLYPLWQPGMVHSRRELFHHPFDP